VSEETVHTDRILTVPNALSLFRLLLIPLFLWLVLVRQADFAAAVVLTVSGVSDWADGVIARRTGQVSRLGQVLDPLVDRLTIVATLLGLALRDLVPWWFVGLLVLRELVLLGLVPVLRRHGLTALPVHYLGKAGTFALFWAFPLILAGSGTSALQHALSAIGWAFAFWGLGLYWYAAVLYLDQTRRIVASGTMVGRPSP